MIQGRSQKIGFFVTALLLTCLFSANALAWDLRVGYHVAMPRIDVREQTYASAGGSLNFSPTLSDTIKGQEFSVGVGIERYVVTLESAKFSYGTTIPASNPAVTVDTSANLAYEEIRLDLTYHLDREIGGLFAGGGFSSVTETISTDAANWSYDTIAPYIKFGIDIIFQSFRIRLHQLHSQYGQQPIRFTTLGVMMFF